MICIVIPILTLGASGAFLNFGAGVGLVASNCSAGMERGLGIKPMPCMACICCKLGIPWSAADMAGMPGMPWLEYIEGRPLLPEMGGEMMMMMSREESHKVNRSEWMVESALTASHSIGYPPMLL